MELGQLECRVQSVTTLCMRNRKSVSNKAEAVQLLTADIAHLNSTIRLVNLSHHPSLQIFFFLFVYISRLRMIGE